MDFQRHQRNPTKIVALTHKWYIIYKLACVYSKKKRNKNQYFFQSFHNLIFKMLMTVDYDSIDFSLCRIYS